MSKEHPMSVFWIEALVIGVLLGFGVYANVQDFPKYVRFDGKKLLAVPHDQEISSFDYTVSPSNALVNIRFEKKEKSDGQ